MWGPEKSSGRNPFPGATNWKPQSSTWMSRICTSRASPGSAPRTKTGPVRAWVRLRSTRGKSAVVKSRVTWSSEALRVSNTTVSPEAMVRTGGRSRFHRLWMLGRSRERWCAVPLPFIDTSRGRGGWSPPSPSAASGGPGLHADYVFLGLGQRDHVGILHVHVEEVDLVGHLAPVGHAFLGDHDAVVEGEGVHHGGPHAAAGHHAGDDQRVHPVVGEDAGEVGAEEGAGLALPDHRLVVPRLQLGHDLVGIDGLGLGRHGAGAGALPAGVLGGGLPMVPAG